VIDVGRSAGWFDALVVYDRNDRSRGSGGLCEGDPDLGGAAGGAVVAAGALEAAGVDEGGEGAVDLAGFFVAAEEVADFGAADAVGASSGECPDVVGGGIAEAVAEHPVGRVAGVAPEREALLPAARPLARIANIQSSSTARVIPEGELTAGVRSASQTLNVRTCCT
jgi:hypothetical protein